MVEMMHSGLFVGMVLAALTLVCAAMYIAVRVVGGRTQSREQAAALTRPSETSRTAAVKPTD